MKAALACLFIYAFVAIAASNYVHTELPVDEYTVFKTCFRSFASVHNPGMRTDEADKLSVAIWRGSGGRWNTAIACSAMCVLESSLRVKKYDEKALQRTDYMGAHYNLLWASLKSEGLVVGSFSKLSPEWLKWKEYFKENPDMGTFFAVLWFTRLSYKLSSLDKTVMVWKVGHRPSAVREIHGIEYLFSVRELSGKFSQYRREAEKIQGGRP